MGGLQSWMIPELRKDWLLSLTGSKRLQWFQASPTDTAMSREEKGNLRVFLRGKETLHRSPSNFGHDHDCISSSFLNQYLARSTGAGHEGVNHGDHDGVNWMSESQPQ